MANNKQLRLDVAQLTDVGRKREHNEDNMAYVIPKDPQVMAKKGALFIVADGMGGHAAGEVASEIAVDTVSNVYYQDDSDDVATSLLHAIKRANALIHQRAAENMLRSGMGTTCVAAVLRGNMAYIANVGDSRAYMARHGKVKQVSQDHSWVAEQVRAGLLTEDQARTHAQRNVITRCLGTQSDVEIDVFPEELEEKDALVLCTDGLSGLVSDDEIRRIVDQSGPQESVYHLVERANENGGPDNITAIVVSVLEVGVEPPGVRRPAYVGGRETGEDTAVLGMAPAASGMNTPPMYSDGRVPSNSLRYASGPLSPAESITAPQPALPASQPRRGRLFYSTIALLLLLIVVLVASGSYLYFRGTKAGVNADQSLKTDQGLLNKAKAELAANPIAALHDLGTAQTNLRNLQRNSSLPGTQLQKVQHLLQNDVVTETQAAITSYNTFASITPLPCSSGSQVSSLPVVPPDMQVKSLALVQAGPQQKSLLYILGMNGKLFEVDNTNLIAVALPAPIAAATVVDITGAGAQLALLTSLTTVSTKGVPGTAFNLSLLTPGATKTDAIVTLPPVTNNQVPTVMTASIPDIYVATTVSPAQSSSSTTILDYTLTRERLLPSAQNTLSFSAPIESMAAFPAHQVFLLLADGTVHNLMVLSAIQQVTAPPVLVQKVIAQPLPVSAKDFSWTMNVPQVVTGGTPTLAVQAQQTSPQVLAVGQVGTSLHLFILDTSLHRILDLQVANSTGSALTPTSGATPAPTSTRAGGGVGAGSSSITLQLTRQYASTSVLAQAKSLAFDALGSQLNSPPGTQPQSSTSGTPTGTHVDVVTQPSASALNLTAFSTDPGGGCAK